MFLNNYFTELGYLSSKVLLPVEEITSVQLAGGLLKSSTSSKMISPRLAIGNQLAKLSRIGFQIKL